MQDIYDESFQTWHRFIETGDLLALNELLDDQVCFHSPVVWKPQEGKMLTGLYMVHQKMKERLEQFKKSG